MKFVTNKKIVRKWYKQETPNKFEESFVIKRLEYSLT